MLLNSIKVTHYLFVVIQGCTFISSKELHLTESDKSSSMLLSEVLSADAFLANWRNNASTYGMYMYIFLHVCMYVCMYVCM